MYYYSHLFSSLGIRSHSRRKRQITCLAALPVCYFTLNSTFTFRANLATGFDLRLLHVNILMDNIQTMLMRKINIVFSTKQGLSAKNVARNVTWRIYTSNKAAGEQCCVTELFEEHTKIPNSPDIELSSFIWKRNNKRPSVVTI
jgi:hypothetical protein